MNDGDALLRAILTEPADDTPRLVYADWLQEQGNEDYAEFIRDQVQWRAGSCDFDLLDANWDRWFPDVMRHDEQGFRRLQNYGGGLAVPLFNGNTVIFTRGFVSAVWFSRTASYLKHAEDGYWGNQPVTEVRIVDRSPAQWESGSTPEAVGMYFWYDKGDMSYEPRAHHLPRELCPLAEGFRADSWLASPPFFPSVVEANAAMSRRAVAYGRSLAGLAANTPSRAAQASAPVA